ncbi:MAG TPA: hypothetical protein VMG99_00240 [Thermoplasmata archaeon]|nr:hypothetical protein [Thermoplasmata archaeon]
MTSVCPACARELPEGATACPGCHLSAALFGSVREAAAQSRDSDPASLRTIAELLETIDLEHPAPPDANAPRSLRSVSRSGAVRTAPLPAPERDAEPLSPLRGLPALPPIATVGELKRRLEEYFALGHRLGLDFTEFERRSNAARLVDDVPSLEVLSREMFVHLSSALAEEFESELARRNELAQLMPTRAADVELEAIGRAIATGDLPGAGRRLTHVTDELARVEEEWQVGRILVTECELLAAAVRDLGGDPAPALGPIEEGRRQIAEGHRAAGERLLAHAATALWSLLEPRLMDDLRRLKERLTEFRASGLDIAPALEELRNLAAELRERNFAGALAAYRRMRAYVERVGAPGGEGLAEPAVVDALRPAPSG